MNDTASSYGQIRLAQRFLRTSMYGSRTVWTQLPDSGSAVKPRSPRKRESESTGAARARRPYYVCSRLRLRLHCVNPPETPPAPYWVFGHHYTGGLCDSLISWLFILVPFESIVNFCLPRPILYTLASAYSNPTIGNL